MRDHWTEIINASQKSIPSEIAYLLLIIGLLIFVWDIFERRSSNIRKKSGLTATSEIISAKGSAHSPSKDYFSKHLGLSSRPDALIREDGFIIPVDIKPMTKKVRDRHVVAMLMHMKLIEEIEGSRPPYGVLLMGTRKRQVRIKNTEEKLRWLDSLIAEMRSIHEGIPAVPAPARYKCKHCDVRGICEYSQHEEPSVET
jgi:CRISPR/Cas system-associated exonuclease Cas4 (RecB family)